MPRYVKTPRKPTDTSKGYRLTRLGVWIDPFPEVPGTQPEKMVYALLARRQIPFQFQEWLHVDIADLQSNSWYRPDFMIPEAKIIIQVQGSYWHSQPDRIIQDSLEAALFEMAGWKVKFWWDYDIYTRLDWLIDSDPDFIGLALGPPLPHVGRWYNDLAGLRTKNRERRKPWTHPSVKTKVRKHTKRAKKLYTRTRGAL